LPPVRPLMPIENRDESNSARKKTKRRRRLRHPRSPLVALPLAIVFTLGAMFFGWVSADPLWLSLGQGSTGTITVTSCSDGRLGRVCEGQFDSTDFSAAPVRISGLPAAEKSDRATTTA